MPHCSGNPRSGKAAQCAVCNGKFGLVRYYSWRTPLCSRECIDRFRARRASDLNWFTWLQIALNQPPPNEQRQFLSTAAAGQFGASPHAPQHRNAENSRAAALPMQRQRAN